MLRYPQIDPIAFSVGPLKVHWYGLMYLLGFVVAWLLGRYRASRSEGDWSAEQVGDLIFYSALGVIIGGRVGYMFFYSLPSFIHQPWILFEVWDGGMSFHGGMLGVIVATWLFSRSQKRRWVDVIDFFTPLVPIGLGAGRIGNFINGELWGKVTTVPWGMVFPNAGVLPRHPSQLYEFLMEGVILFAIVWLYSVKLRPTFAVTAMFLVCYGSFRFFVEFFRQPDPQLGYLAFGWLTMGQVLSLPMILIGSGALIWTYSNHRKKGV